MTRKIVSADTWAKIKTEYQFGEKSIRQIAGENGVTDGAIRAKIKAEGWTQEIRTQVIDIKKNLKGITQSITHAQKPYAAEKMKRLFDVQLEAFGLVQDTAIQVLKGQKNITAMAYNKLREAKTAQEIYQISTIFKSQGMDVPGAMKAIGIGTDVKLPEAPIDVTNNDSDLSPSEIYNKLVRGV